VNIKKTGHFSQIYHLLNPNLLIKLNYRNITHPTLHNVGFAIWFFFCRVRFCQIPGNFEVPLFAALFNSRCFQLTKSSFLAIFVIPNFSISIINPKGLCDGFK
jgi:hypothetical protein